MMIPTIAPQVHFGINCWWSRQQCPESSGKHGCKIFSKGLGAACCIKLKSMTQYPRPALNFSSEESKSEQSGLFWFTFQFQNLEKNIVKVVRQIPQILCQHSTLMIYCDSPLVACFSYNRCNFQCSVSISLLLGKNAPFLI